MTELTAWPGMIDAVTLDKVRSVARKYARPDKQVFLLTGDRRIVEEAARDLQLGYVILINPNGSLRNGSSQAR